MVYNNWRKDAGDSEKALMSIKDSILPKLITGKIHTIENRREDILLLLDQKSGVDYIRENNVGLQGIAARVQWDSGFRSYPFNSFTIRQERKTGTKTELEKRIKQIKEGYFYPAFTLQAYFDDRINNNCLSIAIIKTLDLYAFIDKQPKHVHSNSSDNKFLYVKWQDIKRFGYKIKEYYK